MAGTTLTINHSNLFSSSALPSELVQNGSDGKAQKRSQEKVEKRMTFTPSRPAKATDDGFMASILDRPEWRRFASGQVAKSTS